MSPSMESASPDQPVGAIDAEGFPGFFEQSLPRVYGYLLARCGGRVVVAEDLCQETFLAAVNELRKGRIVETPAAWIFGIARHKLLDHYRRSRQLETRFDGEREVDVAMSIDLDGDDVRERVIAALAAVPPAQRAVLVLHYLRGELAGASTVVAEVAQERGVRGRDVAEAVVCELGADGVLDRAAGVAEKDLEALRHVQTIVVHLA